MTKKKPTKKRGVPMDTLIVWNNERIVVRHVRRDMVDSTLFALRAEMILDEYDWRWQLVTGKLEVQS